MHRGCWWSPSSNGIPFVKVDESNMPAHRVACQTNDNHHDSAQRHNHHQHYQSNSNNFEDHRHPFAGKDDPMTTLGCANTPLDNNKRMTKSNFDNNVLWSKSPKDANEHLTRTYFYLTIMLEMTRMVETHC